MEERLTQPSLLEPQFTPSPAQEDPTWVAVAHVSVDSALPHLDRLFDYGIPNQLAQDVHVGSRVSIRFAGRITDGFVIEISPTTQQRDLKPIRRVLGAIPVATPEILTLAEELSRRYAGAPADVLRLAVPPRHATTEKRVLAQPRVTPLAWSTVDHSPWEDYPAGAAFIRRLTDGESPRAIWSALPSPVAQGPQHWAEAIRAATEATLASGKGVLILVPTAHDLDVVEHSLTQGRVHHTRLSADLGPAARYESFLRILTGEFRVVLGTRAAAYAPVHNLGLVVCWDEGNDAYVEPRAPYPHARDTLVLRASLTGAAALIGGFARSPNAHHLVNTSWAHNLAAERAVVRARTPRVFVPDEFDLDREGGSGYARIPGFAWRKIRSALQRGPVLLQVPRAGYTPGLACRTCRHTARCHICAGPLRQAAGSSPSCSWCMRAAGDWVCPHCSGRTLRARSVGVQRTADELGRAFPGVPVRVSGSSAGRLEMLSPAPALVVATPGAEPSAANAYELGVFLDGGLLTDMPYLTAPIAALHRWLRAAALVSGEVIILGDPLIAPAQAAVRWDPAGFAQRELTEWNSLGFPPGHTVVAVTGEKSDVTSFLRYLPEMDGVSLLGPAPIADAISTPGEDDLGIAVRTPLVRLLVRANAAQHLELTQAVRAALRIRSAKRDGKPIKVKVNPIEEL